MSTSVRVPGDPRSPHPVATARAVELLARDERVRAVTEVGSAAFGRADAASDVDLLAWLDDDAGLEACQEVVRGFLDALRNELAGAEVDVVELGPQPGTTWWQAFVRAEGMPVVDLVALDPGATDLDHWVSTPRHGEPITWLDRDGRLADGPPRTDEAALARRREDELATLLQRRAMFADMPLKELGRGRLVDAHQFHRRMVVEPLVTLLGMRHRPLRFDFGMRYLHEELPAGDAERLLAIVQPSGADQLRAAVEDGLAWFDELAASLAEA